MLYDAILILGALATSLAGLLLCWHAWKSGSAGWRTVAVAAIPWTISTGLWIFRFGAEVGIPLALETAALVAFAFILTRIEHRAEKSVKPRVAPPSPPRNYWRGTARFLVASLLGFAAALGPTMLFATQAPLAEQTRLILAALAVPSLRCAAIAWTACDRRLLLQTLTLAGIALGGAGLTFAMA